MPERLPTWEDYRPGDPDVCVWCHVPGCTGYPENPPEHRPTCPSVTGLWPVQPHHVERGTCCALCEYVFVLGDLSVAVPDPADPDWSITVCRFCGITRRDEAQELIPRARPW